MMKKTLLASALLCAALGAVSAQEGAVLLDAGSLERYSKLFLNANGTIAPKYYRAAWEDNYNRISAFGGEYLDDIDTPLEIALLSTCAGVIDIRPAEADRILPANNPRLSDLKLGAAAYMDMQAAKFLGGGPAPYAAALQFITGRGNVTEADIRDFVKQGIAAEVDKQFKNTLLPPAEIQAVKDILAAFFIRPNTATFNAVRDVDYIYTITTMSSSGEKKKASADVMHAYGSALLSLNPKLSTAVIKDLADFRAKSGTNNIVALANMVRQYITQQ